MARLARHNKILELIAKYEVDTQEELQTHLHECGIDVTQATISRDIKELGIVKSLYDGKYRYTLEHGNNGNISIKMANMFREAVVTIDSVRNLVVVKTLNGSAASSGVLIDQLELNGALCSISGDDAVLVVFRDEEYVEDAVRRLNELIG